MSTRRISFNVSEDVYKALGQLFESEHTSVSQSFKDLAYSITNTPAEPTATERAQAERLEASEKRLAEKKAKLRVDREVPKNPLDKVSKVEKVKSANAENNKTVVPERTNSTMPRPQTKNPMGHRKPQFTN